MKSEFYRKVWDVCMKIPKGEVRTYKWIAQKIGYPKAYRAVGNALAKNPFAPVVPCHRVIRSDGKLGGYSKGINKKIELLEKEKIKPRDYHPDVTSGVILSPHRADEGSIIRFSE